MESNQSILPMESQSDQGLQQLDERMRNTAIPSTEAGVSPPNSRPRTPSPERFFSPDSLWAQRNSITHGRDLATELTSADGSTVNEHVQEPVPRFPICNVSSGPSESFLPLTANIDSDGRASAWGADALGNLGAITTNEGVDDDFASFRLNGTDSGFDSMAISRELSSAGWANDSPVPSRSRTWEVGNVLPIAEGGERHTYQDHISSDNRSSTVPGKQDTCKKPCVDMEDLDQAAKKFGPLVAGKVNGEASTRLNEQGSPIKPLSRRTTVEVEDVSDEDTRPHSRHSTDIKPESIHTGRFPVSRKRRLFRTATEHPHFRRMRRKGRDGLTFEHTTSSTTTIHTIIDACTGEVVGREVEEVTSTRTSNGVDPTRLAESRGDGEDKQEYLDDGNDLDLGLLSPIERISTLPNPYNVIPTLKPSGGRQDDGTPETTFPQDTGALHIEAHTTNHTVTVAEQGRQNLPSSQAIEEIVHRIELPPSASTQNLIEASIRISQVNQTTTAVNHSHQTEPNDSDGEAENGQYSTLEIHTTTQLYQELFHSTSRSTLSHFSTLQSPTSPIDRLFSRSRNSIRRLLSSRERFIGTRSRSFLRRLRGELQDLDREIGAGVGGGPVGHIGHPYLVNWTPAPGMDGQAIELDAGMVLPGQGASGPIELDGIERPPGPYELHVVSEPDYGWGTYGAQPHLFRSGTFSNSSRTQTYVCTSIFGPNFKRSRSRRPYNGLEGVCKVYMQQIDEKLEIGMRNCELETPNVARWPEPLGYLVWCLGFVGGHMRDSETVKDFVEAYYKELEKAMKVGPGGLGGVDRPPTSRMDGNGSATDQPDDKYRRLAYQWMLFSLEAWTMLDFTSIVGEKNRQNPMVSDDFCTRSLKDMITPLLPRAHLRYSRVGTGELSGNPAVTLTQLFPHEMTASMLSSLTGITFIWTTDISSHLMLDRKTRRVSLYSNVVVSFLHTIAGDESSLNRAGLTSLHRIHSEILESYKLLFGHSEKDHKLFREIDVANRTKGFYDIFSIPKADTEPRCYYTVATSNSSNNMQDHPSDFLVYGERLVELRNLFKPTGLSGLWKDKRDSLQWWTFWAVVAIGLVSLVLAIFQTALGTIQAYASMKALQPH